MVRQYLSIYKIINSTFKMYRFLKMYRYNIKKDGVDHSWVWKVNNSVIFPICFSNNLFIRSAGVKIRHTQTQTQFIIISKKSYRLFYLSLHPFVFTNYIQALLAAEINQRKCAETMKFLLSRQKPDGSFQNLGATIYVLPSLVGALPYDVNAITCPENKTGEHIFYHERSARLTLLRFIYQFFFYLPQ